jgi:hypothetical protein
MEWLELFQKILASIFLVLMSSLLLFWSFPEGYFLRNTLHLTFGKYIYWAGLDTYWALFAPHPVSKNFLIGFELEFADGTLRPWKLPEYRLNEQEYQDTSHFRYVKMHNQLLSQQDPVPKEAICRYIMRKVQKEGPTESRLSRIHIIRFYEPANSIAALQLSWLSQRAFTFEVPTKEAVPG